MSEVDTLRARVKALEDAILDIDAKATPYHTVEEAGEEWVKTYLLPCGALHRALGLLGRNGKNWRAPPIATPIAGVVVHSDRAPTDEESRLIAEVIEAARVRFAEPAS